MFFNWRHHASTALISVKEKYYTYEPLCRHKDMMVRLHMKCRNVTAESRVCVLSAVRLRPQKHLVSYVKLISNSVIRSKKITLWNSHTFESVGLVYIDMNFPFEGSFKLKELWPITDGAAGSYLSGAEGIACYACTINFHFAQMVAGQILNFFPCLHSYLNFQWNRSYKHLVPLINLLFRQ